MGFKGEQIGSFLLDRKLTRCPEGEVWKARGPAGPVSMTLYYEPSWVGAVREAGVPEGIPDSPFVSRVVASDIGAHRPWVAWAHVEQRRLADIMAKRAYLPLAAALPLVLQVSRGLEALHKAGLAHHDLRPENVVVDPTGRTWLTFPQTQAYRARVLDQLADKGAALPADLAASLKAYMPPEHKRKKQITGPEGDMYAFGLLVYRALTGQEPDPFQPRFPSQLDKRIPKIIDEVLMNALERQLRARRQNALGLYERLLIGFQKSGFRLETDDAPVTWVKRTPWQTHVQWGQDAESELEELLKETHDQTV